ncbi:hypothetical protein ABEX00_00035 [Bacillus safensis]|nr:hypothetical protein [Bacillus safensis]
MKKVLSFLVVILLLSSFTFNQSIFAESVSNEDENLAEELNISTEELNNLGTIIEDGIQKLDDEKKSDQVKVSENLILETSQEETVGFVPPSSLAESSSTIDNMVMASAAKKKKSQYVRVKKQMKLKNILGFTVLTLNSVGVFTVNGSTSTPTDAYGTHEGTVWTVSHSSKKSKKSAKSYVRNTFKGKLKIGIDPINMTFQSFNFSNTIYCSAKGKATSFWD